jgi:hypothetical protein
MGSKRKPFITTKAVSEAVMKSGRESDWSESQIKEIWWLAADHLSELEVSAAFDDVLSRPNISQIFIRRNYKVTGYETLQLGRGSAPICDPTRILGEKVKALIKMEWPLAISEVGDSRWHDFSDSLLMACMKKNLVPNRLKGKKVEQDLGF